MPTLKRKPVPLVPLPDSVIDGTLPLDTDVFYLQATGEVFLDFEAYSSRISFYLQKIFSCEATGKTGIDFYTALNSERRESDQMNQRFPAALKSRVLQTVQFQIMGRLDSLVDRVYERYKDRFVIDETCLVDVMGDKYPCRVHRVFPPKSIRDIVVSGGDPAFPVTPDFKPSGFDFSRWAHSVAFDLANSDEVVKAYDRADDYAYTVQLTDETGRYEGSLTEAKARNLSRDRLAFSKSIMKRYLKETLQRDSLISSPWIVKPRVARQFGLPTAEPDAIRDRNKEIRTGALAKRKRKAEESDISGHRKKAKEMLLEDGGYSVDGFPEKAKPRTIKYPIEDLALDPFSIYDGRILRRRHGEALVLPAYPALHANFGLPMDLVSDYLQVYNTLTVFGWPLILSNFTLDQFYDALHHYRPEPRCMLLAEMHGCMLALLVLENFRVPGTQSATATGVLPPFATPVPGSADAQVTDEERDHYVRTALMYSRKWDRSKRLAAATGRQGWEKHLIGCLCQRGGIETMPQLPRILKHLFMYSKAARNPGTVIEEPPEDELASDDGADGVDAAEEEAFEDGKTPSKQYLTLDVRDKLVLLRFLCEMIMATRTVRRYIEDCENALTAFRKRRIAINADRKSLSLQKSAMEGNEKARAALAAAEDADLEAAIAEAQVNGTMDVPPDEEEAVKADVGSDVDELASDAESTGNISTDLSFSGAAGSKQGALREKSLRKQAEAAAKAQEALSARQAARKKNLKIQGTSVDRKRVDDGLASLDEQDDWLDREFRRHKEVMRIKPIGKDRFGQQYWFFDGIGTMELFDEQDKSVYHTARIFVQGPSPEDWQIAVETVGEQQRLADRAAYEMAPQGLLQSGEWAYLESEAEVDQLVAFLNVKGNREMALKLALKSLRPYIVGGMKRKEEDFGVSSDGQTQMEAGAVEEVGDDTSISRRSSRSQRNGVNANGTSTSTKTSRHSDALGVQPAHSYLRYVNAFAQK